MADDGILRIGTEVDISNIRAGMAEAAATVKASTTQMEAAYAQLAVATVDYTGKTATLRDGIKQLVSGAIPYSETVKLLTPLLKEQIGAYDDLKNAKAALASVENVETQQVRSNISARMAATAELRVFEGNLMGSTRAAGAFLNLLPGIGAAMQVAFPVFGAIALAGVVVDLGKKIYDSFDLGGEKAQEFQQNLASVATSYRDLIDRTELETTRLEAQTAKLEHRPMPNAAKEALEEASVAADDMLAKLDSLITKEQTLLKSQILNPTPLAQAFQGTGNTHQEQVMLEQHELWLERAKSMSDQLNESRSYGNQLMERLSTITKEINAGQPEGWEGVAGLQREKQALELLIADQQKEQDAIKATMALQGAQANNTAAQAAHQSDSLGNRAAEAERKAQEAAIQAARKHLDELKAVHDLSAASEAAYWEGLAAKAKQGSLFYITAMDEANKAAARANKPDTGWLDQMEQQQKRQQEQEEGQRRAQEAQDAYSLTVAESASRIKDAQDKASESLALANVKASEASGGMSKLSAAQETARIHAKEYAEQLARLDEEIKKVQEDSSLSPKQQQQQIGQLQSQKIQVQGQANVSAVQDQSSITQQIAQPYLNAFDQINASWLKVQDQMLFSTRNLSLQFAKMGQSILISIINNFEKMALVAAEKEAVMVLAHSVANQQKVASDAVTAAESEGISSASLAKKLVMELIGLFHHSATNAAKTASDVTSAAVGTAATIPANILAAESYAAVAAVAAMSSAAAIPVIGWAMAPAVGAGMYAVAQGFAAMASFDTGTGYVPRDGMAYLHEGEAVVPAPTMQQLRGNEGDLGGDLTINHTTNIQGHTEKAVIAAIRRNPGEIAGALKRHMRQGGRG